MPSSLPWQWLQRYFSCCCDHPCHYISGTCCWKPSSLLSNVHFRNSTKNCSTSSLLLTLFTFTFEPFFSNYELFMYFCFCSFSHSYGSFNRDIFNILDLLWVSCTLFIHIFTLCMYRKSSCTFICQVAPLTSSCQFSTFHQCPLLPQASLSFI